MPCAYVLVRCWCPRLVSAMVPEAGGGEAAGSVAPQSRVARNGGSWFRLARAYISRYAMNAGLPGVLGVLLLAASFLGSYAGGVDNDRRTAALVEELSRMERSASESPSGSDERTRVVAFFDRFPPIGTLPDRLRRLNEHGAAHGIRVQRTDYGSTGVAGTPLTLVSLTIPVQADAEALYVWLRALLREMPEIALESVSLKRETSDAATVEADIRLQLYLRGRS